MKTEAVKKFFFHFVIFLIALLMNCAGSVYARHITLPLYLDSIMTIGVVAVSGLVPGILCAVFSNGLLTFLGYKMMPFVLCHVLTAVSAWLIFRRKKSAELDLEMFLWAGFLSGILNAICGNIISDTLFSALTGVPNVDTSVQGIYIATENLSLATYLAGTIENLTDKMISAVLSFLLYICIQKIKKRAIKGD